MEVIVKTAQFKRPKNVRSLLKNEVIIKKLTRVLQDDHDYSREKTNFFQTNNCQITRNLDNLPMKAKTQANEQKQSQSILGRKRCQSEIISYVNPENVIGGSDDQDGKRAKNTDCSSSDKFSKETELTISDCYSLSVPHINDPLDIEKISENSKKKNSSHLKLNSDLPFTFDFLQNYNDFCLPMCWSKSRTPTKPYCVIFSEATSLKIDEKILIISKKQIVIDIKLNLQIILLDKYFSPEQINCPNKISNIEEMNDVLKKVIALKLCPGIHSDINFQSGFLYRDIMSNYRHVNCNFLLKNEAICSYCEKIRIQSHVSFENDQHNIENMTLSQQTDDFNTKFRILYQNEKKRANKLKKQVDRYKQKLIKCQNAMKKISAENSKVKRLVKMENFPQNCKLLVGEILKMSKLKARNGQRYSNEWILFAKRLHKESPKVYKFLRSEHYIPLPSWRTIQRISAREQAKVGSNYKFMELVDSENQSEKSHLSEVLVHEKLTSALN